MPSVLMPSSFRILEAAIPGPVVGILRQKRVLVESVDRSAHISLACFAVASRIYRSIPSSSNMLANRRAWSTVAWVS